MTYVMVIKPVLLIAVISIIKSERCHWHCFYKNESSSWNNRDLKNLQINLMQNRLQF